MEGIAGAFVDVKVMELDGTWKGITSWVVLNGIPMDGVNFSVHGGVDQNSVVLPGRWVMREVGWSCELGDCCGD